MLGAFMSAVYSKLDFNLKTVVALVEMAMKHASGDWL
jgi:hypothetical protein